MKPEATAFAPASVGNVGVGFDILGHTIAGPGDRVTVRRTGERGVHIIAVRGCETPLPTAADRNTAGAALIALRDALALPFGFEIEIDKGIPYGSGMGGSAASAVARYLDNPGRGLWRDELRADGEFAPGPSPASSLYHIVGGLQALLARAL